MKCFAAGLFIVASLTAVGAHAQSLPSGGALSVDVGAGFTAVHANAPPAQCGCFYMEGFNAQVAVNTATPFSFILDYGRTKASNINGLNRNLTLSTYMEGVRYSFLRSHRFVPFADIMIGLGQTGSNYAIDKNAYGFAYAAGGGLDYKLSSRFDLRPAQVEYLKTDISNGVNNRQNQIRMSAGVIFHLTSSPR